MNYFTFNGHSSTEFDIRIQKKNTYSSSKRDITLTAIPGRNGDLISSNKRFLNAIVSYSCYVPAKSVEELSDKITAIKNWLYRDVDAYHDLSDSYDPKFVRKSVFNNKLDIFDEVSKIGTFTVQFSAKPQRYDSDGLVSTRYERATGLVNPYSLAAKPYIKVNGSGDGRLIIQNSAGNKIWSFSSIDEYLVIDSEEMNCYKGTVLENSKVSGDGFPEFVEGLNTISFDGDIESIEIKPRWVSL